MSVTDTLAEASFNHPLTVVDFRADWCGPCRTMDPIVDALHAELPEIRVITVDVDTETELAALYNVQSIPTFVLLRDGNMLDRLTGAVPAERFRAFVSAQLPVVAS